MKKHAKKEAVKEHGKISLSMPENGNQDDEEPEIQDQEVFYAQKKR